MTIKLSTTNSVNKTLQHKALWDLDTPHVDVWDSRGCSSEGGFQLLSHSSGLRQSSDGTSFSLSEIHRNLERFVRSGENYHLLSSVNKLSISRSRKTPFHTASRDFDSSGFLCEMWRRNKHC